jgi:hypothetical protein
MQSKDPSHFVNFLRFLQHKDQTWEQFKNSPDATRGALMQEAVDEDFSDRRAGLAAVRRAFQLGIGGPVEEAAGFEADRDTDA